jgi:hypothetical protein
MEAGSRTMEAGSKTMEAGGKTMETRGNPMEIAGKSAKSNRGTPKNMGLSSTFLCRERA